MVIFTKKIKTKEGINSFDLDKIKKGIPAGYKVTDNTPTISYTANHVVIAYTCQAQKAQLAPAKAKPKTKPKTKQK